MAEVHSTRAHARLGPSAAHRWMHCPGSVRASEGIPSTTSKYAAEGTAAHELAAAVLQFNVSSAREYLGQVVDIEAPGKENIISWHGVPNGRNIWRITDEMADAVDTYVDHVRGLIAAVDEGMPIVDIEQRLDMSHVHPEIFGTGDAVVYDPVGEHLHVCDFKYGKGVVVDVENNPQLFLYGVGAARRYHNQPLRKLTLHVIQPRAEGEPIRSWETDVLELFDFEGEIAEAARRTDDANAPRAAGDWCRFCPAAPICPTNREAAMADAQAEFADGDLTTPGIEGLSPDQRGDILRAADRIFNWVTSVQEYEHARALAGDAPAGFKLVAKRATRRWKDEELAKTSLIAADVSSDDLYEKKFISPAKAEKIVGKKTFAAWEPDLVVKQSSGTNLVPVEDPRPAVTADAAAEFATVDVED